MIPLALYGLDHPKIPVLLVDFRDGGNAKRREVSRRLLEDVARNLLSLSRFGDVHYFLGRSLYDYVTGKRGMDVNQPTRLRAYSQLKLLLSLSASLNPELRAEIGKRLGRVSANPLENDSAAEARLARAGYEALLAHARARRGGLSERLERDRRAELVPASHRRASRVLFRLGNLLSLGLYQHREDAPASERRSRLDAERRLAYHRRFLRDVSKSAPPLEAAWSLEDVRRSLSFVAEHGKRAGDTTATAVARVFTLTEDEGLRRLCLESLYRIDSAAAKRGLLRVYQAPNVDAQLRALSLEYLRKALGEDQRVAPDDARAVAALGGQ